MRQLELFPGRPANGPCGDSSSPACPLCGPDALTRRFGRGAGSIWVCVRCEQHFEVTVASTAGKPADAQTSHIAASNFDGKSAIVQVDFGERIPEDLKCSETRSPRPQTAVSRMSEFSGVATPGRHGPSTGDSTARKETHSASRRTP